MKPEKDELDHIVLFKKLLSISTQPKKIEKLKDMDIMRFDGNASDTSIAYELKKEDRFKGISYLIILDTEDKKFNYYRLRLHTLGKLEIVKELAEKTYEVKFGKPKATTESYVETEVLIYSTTKGNLKIEVIQRTWDEGPFGPGGVSGIHVTKIKE